MDVESSLLTLIEKEEVPLFGVANCDRFRHAGPFLHPKTLVPSAASAIVFGVSFVGPGLSVDQKTNLSSEQHWHQNQRVHGTITRLRAQIIDLLDNYGYLACILGGYNPTMRPTFSYRLVQYEAGVGVYGRFGVCINPGLGCYYTVGALLTDAVLCPTNGLALLDFQPCRECRKCADECPTKAIDPSMQPETGYDRERCIKFIQATKKKYGPEAKVCGRCFSVCPWGYQKTCAP